MMWQLSFRTDRADSVCFTFSLRTCSIEHFVSESLFEVSCYIVIFVAWYQAQLVKYPILRTVISHRNQNFSSFASVLIEARYRAFESPFKAVQDGYFCYNFSEQSFFKILNFVLTLTAFSPLYGCTGKNMVDPRVFDANCKISFFLMIT